MILIGLISFSYILIFLLAPKDVADYTVADISYLYESKNRLLIRTAYEYSNKEDIRSFPMNLGNWNGSDFKYSDSVYASLKADIFLSRAYSSGNDIIWMDLINSKVGESFHSPEICLEGSWTINNKSIVEFRIADPPNPFTRLYAYRLDINNNFNSQEQVMVYWFMFKRFGENDAVSMIRLSSPVKENYNATFDSIKGFVEKELFEAMYESGKPDNITSAEYIIKEYGNKGVFAIAMILLVPLSLVFKGIRRNK
ncbi:MAG: exosortase-associated EpsI family protein [Candidatus Methanoperedens sp.]|nr:exosortase-associated EpsI family protein [Candidatus Methanoperedens sp.]